MLFSLSPKEAKALLLVAESALEDVDVVVEAIIQDRSLDGIDEFNEAIGTQQDFERDLKRAKEELESKL